MMNTSRCFFTAMAASLCAAGLVASVAVQAEGVPQDLGQRLVRYGAPATEKLAHAADGLSTSLHGFCRQPGGDAPEQVRQRFRDIVLAWAGVEFLRFGPLVEANRYERLAFWPDPRGVMQRQVQALLASPEAAGLTADSVAARSVAQQGLPALEFVLYRQSGLLDGAARADRQADCAYAQAAAGAFAATARQLAQAWSPQGEFARWYAQPGPANPLYRSQQEVAAEALKALSTGLQFAREVKLAPVLAAPYQANRARRAPFWRSGLTAASMAASVQGMLDFHDAAGWQFAAGEAWRGASLRHDLVQLHGVLAGLQAPIEQALQDAGQRRQLELATLLFKNAKALLDQDLAPYLGVTLGFNALDGD